jgi:epoxide hydrolase 4
VSGVDIHDVTVESGGVRLHVARAGAGPPVILLHGFPEDWRSWRRQVEPLVACGYSVWMPDLRGYNQSSRPGARESYHLRHLVDDVAAVVRATGHSRARLCGHDWGGVIAWAFAHGCPDMVERLVILNAPHPTLYARRLRRPSQMLRAWYVAFFMLPRLPERVLAAYDFAAVRRLLQTVPALPAFSAGEIDAYVDALSQPGALTAALNYYRANAAIARSALRHTGQIEAETLVIWGERDPALDVALLDGLGEFAPQVQVHRIASAGHWVHREASDEVNRVLIEFLR